jgi:uncharacterized membrane protein
VLVGCLCVGWLSVCLLVVCVLGGCLCVGWLSVWLLVVCVLGRQNYIKGKVSWVKC